METENKTVKNYFPDALGYYGRVFQLETPEVYFKTQCERLKQIMTVKVAKLNLLEKLLLVEENELEKLKLQFKTLDRRLAFRDGRLKVCRYAGERKHKMPPIVKDRVTFKGIRSALTKMSIADKEELLKDLLS